MVFGYYVLLMSMHAPSPSELASSFAQSSSQTSWEPAQLELLGHTLRDGLACAQQAWPTLSVDAGAFAAFLGERVPEDELLTRSLSDLYLCFACIQPNNERAIEAFNAEHHAGILATLQRVNSGMVEVDELAQELYVKLFFATERGAVGKIASYAGKNALRYWLRAVALRMAFDQLRSSQVKGRQVELESSIGFEEVFDEQDPELLHQQRLYGDELKRAIAKTISELPAKDRLLLQYHYTDGLNIEKIGKILSVHKTTAFRRLESIRAKIVDETRVRMCQVLGVDSDELISVMRVIPSHIQLSINRILLQND